MNTSASEAEELHSEHTHPGPKTYIMIALILGILTAAEVAVFYIPALEPALVPILLTLTTGKFALVVMFYMHLRFDSRVFSSVFVAPLLLAIAVIITVLILFKVLPYYTPV